MKIRKGKENIVIQTLVALVLFYEKCKIFKKITNFRS